MRRPAAARRACVTTSLRSATPDGGSLLFCADTRSRVKSVSSRCKHALDRSDVRHVSTVPARARIAHSGVPPSGRRAPRGRAQQPRVAPEAMRGRVAAGVALAAALRRSGGCDFARARASLSSAASAQAAAPSAGASEPQSAPQAPRHSRRAAVSLAAAALALAAAAKADVLPRPVREAADAAAAAAALARAVWTDAAADGAAGARADCPPRTRSDTV
jgi:hypothetical protein